MPTGSANYNVKKSKTANKKKPAAAKKRKMEQIIAIALNTSSKIKRKTTKSKNVKKTK